MEQLTTATLTQLPQVRALGRHTGRDPLTLFWTASTAAAQTTAVMMTFHARREGEKSLFIPVSSLQHGVEQHIDDHDEDEQHQRDAEQRLLLKR